MLTSMAMMAALLLLVYKTRIGIAMRATSQNPQVAGPDGHQHQYRDLGHLHGRRGSGRYRRRDGRLATTASPITRWASCSALKAFSAAVLGGIGNLGGAVLGGLLMGLIEALGAGYMGDITNVCFLNSFLPGFSEYVRGQSPTASLFGSNYKDVYAFIVLILVLVFRPSGLLGERVGDRA